MPVSIPFDGPVAVVTVTVGTPLTVRDVVVLLTLPREIVVFAAN